MCGCGYVSFAIAYLNKMRAQVTLSSLIPIFIVVLIVFMYKLLCPCNWNIWYIILVRLCVVIGPQLILTFGVLTIC